MGSPWFFLVCLSKHRKMQLLHLHWEPQHCWRTMMDWIMSCQTSSVKRLTASISECQCVWKWGHHWRNQLKGADSGVRWGSNSIWLASLQKNKEERFGHSSTYRDHVKMKAEIRLMHVQTGNGHNHQQPPDARNEAWNGFFLRALQRINPANTLISDFQPLELWDSLKPPKVCGPLLWQPQQTNRMISKVIVLKRLFAHVFPGEWRVKGTRVGTRQNWVLFAA